LLSKNFKASGEGEAACAATTVLSRTKVVKWAIPVMVR
jgi:hypothetical protein